MAAVPKQLTPWKPGQSGNPAGRTKLPDELRAIKALTVEEACRLISKYARAGHGTFQSILDDPTTPAIDACIVAIFAAGIKNGDWTRLSFLLDRAIGKVPVAIEDDEDRAARRELENLSDEELEKIIAARLLKKAG